MSDYFEIRWHGRGGQGTVTGAKSLAEAVQGTGKYVTAFPEYGPERRGAPVRSFNRFSERKIRIHTPVQNPDLIIVADATLLGNSQIKEGISRETVFVVNTEKSAAETAGALGLQGNRLYTVPANGISFDLFKKEIPNSALLGAFARAFPGVISVERLLGEIRVIFGKLFSPDLVEKNLEAVTRGFYQGEQT